MERWSGRVAVVTGASSGIGAAIAVELVKKGLKVVGLARRVEKMEKLSDSLKAEPGKLHTIKCDITNETELQDAFDWIKTNLGGVDILINNAGYSPTNSLIDGPVESWKKILDVNVLALSVCTQKALQSMKERGVDDGHIIHINSLGGHAVPPIELPIFMYSGSKHAVTALTEGLRRELVNIKSKIRVSSISPAFVDTQMVAEEIKKANPCLQPKDVADTVVYILGTPPHVQIHELILIPV